MGRTRIMIVDDEILTAMALRIGLIDLGYDVCKLYASGEEALKNLIWEKPDVVIMDISLNGEVDGIKTAEKIRKKFGLPVIFLTGYSSRELMEKAKIAKPCHYFVKPVPCEMLKIEIDSAIERQKENST